MWTDSKLDVRFAARQLVRNPVFAAVAVLTLGIGIGANAATYSVVDGILFRPLPYPQPEALVSIWADYTRRDGPATEWLAFPNLLDLKEEARSLEAAAAWGPWGPTLTGRGEPRQLIAAQVSEGMFQEVLRILPAAGRPFDAREHVAGGPKAVVLSHGFWQRALGGEASVLGTTLNLNGEPYAVAGIMPERFVPPFVPGAELWAPMQVDWSDPPCGRGCAIVRAIGRITPGATVGVARTESAAIGARLERAYPQANAGVGFNIVPLRQDMVSQASTALWVLLGAVGFVLLMACVNVANLMLGRAAARRGEIALRSALGAGSRRIVRQLLTESLLIAALGGLLGLAIGWAGTGALVALAPPGTPRIGEVVLDLRVLGFIAAITVAAGLIFGTAPALRAARRNLNADLREGGARSGAGRGSARLRNGLVVSQVALALVLLVGAGLLLRSFQNLRRADLGFQPDGVLTFFMGLPPTRYPDREATRAFFLDVERRIQALPGVSGVGSVSSLPLSGADGDVDFLLEGRPPPEPGAQNQVWLRRATPGYLPTMGIELVGGRSFTDSDDAEAPRVVIVNETLATRYFGGGSAVGQRINVNDPDQPVWREIVGVAEDVRNFGVRQESRNAMYVPFGQAPAGAMFVTVASALAPESTVPALRRAIADVDPSLAMARVETMTSIVERSLAPDRFVAALLGLFAAVALALAVVGIYGILSYSVTSRFPEMGLRIALGGTAGTVSRMVMSRSLLLVAAGVGVGLLGVAAVTRTLGSLLYGVRPSDPLVLLAVVGLLAGVGLIACTVPARRAGRVDPITVLKAD